MLRYLNYPKRYELSPNHSRILSRAANVFFCVVILVAVAVLGWGEHGAAEDKTVLAKGARIAVFPLDLQGEAKHHTGVIHGAIRQVLEATEPAQLDFFFNRGTIPYRGRTFDISDQKIWDKKGFFSSRLEPKSAYVSEIGRALNFDFIMMYSYYVGWNARDYIHVYLVDVRQRKVYYERGTTQSFDHVYSGVREGFGETVRLTNRVLKEYEQHRLPSEVFVAQPQASEPTPSDTPKPVAPDAVTASQQNETPQEPQTPSVEIEAPVEPRHALTVQAVPADSRVTIVNSSTPYRPGVELPPGRYELLVQRDGYQAQRHAVELQDQDVDVSVRLAPVTYALTVQTTPVDSRVTLLNSDIPYQPGVELPAGRYDVEVARDGYHAQRLTVALQNRDVSFPVTLERVGYALTVNVIPRDSTIDILNEAIDYHPGVTLAPGRYVLEIKHDGYKTVQRAVRVQDADVTLNVSLVMKTYDLTVQAMPPDSRIKLLNTETPYRPGVSLPAGRYEVLVERDGYQAQRRTVVLENRDVEVPVVLPRHTYALQVETKPVDSRIRILNLPSDYSPGMDLPPGQYHVEVAKEGYETKRAWVTIDDRDMTLNVDLAPVQYALQIQAEPSDSTITLLNSDEPYRPGVALPPGAYKLRVAREGYQAVERTVRIQDTDVRLGVTLEPIVIAQADTEPPELDVTSHNTTGVMHVPATVTRTTIRGYATDPSGVAEVVVNGTRAIVDAQGKFSAEIVLEEGRNDILVTAVDAYRNAARTDFAINRASGLDIAQRRTALVVGNSDYTMSPLRNPGNDANDMAAQLEKLGFKVLLYLDATRRQMEEAVDVFSNELRQGGVGLFYYAGHGVQVDGQNYLIPLDARLEEAVDVKYQTIPAGWVVDRMENAGNELNIVVLDACRDNPFSRGWRSVHRGLAGMQAARGTLIAYATEPGGVAQDGRDRNGIYTKHLLSYITAPGWTIERVFKQVRIAVVNETRGQQVPWESSSLLGDFYFVRE